MFPLNELSSTAVVTGFADPVKSPTDLDLLVDWERAGKYLNDASEGLLVKVWKIEGIIDQDTGVVSALLSAPGGVAVGVPEVVPFAFTDIRSLALAFDQNMNPMIAYMHGTLAKYYWYDSLAPGMVHSTLPVGCYDIRVTMDEKRPFNIANSDVVMAYLRAGNLCVRYQRDRYLVEYIMKSGLGPDARLISVSLNRGLRIQFHLRFATVDDDQAKVVTEPYLADVVSSLNRKAGLDPERFNVADLWDQNVPGFKVSGADGLDKSVTALMDIYFFDKSEHDRKIFYPARGGDVVMRIPYDDLVEGNPISLKQTRVDETKLPRKINLNHIDPDAGYAKNKQTASRRSNMVKAKKEETKDAEPVLTVDQAAAAAATMLKIKWSEQIEYNFATSKKYTELTTADVIEVEDNLGTWHRMRIEDRNEDDGIIEWKGKQDAGLRTYKLVRTGAAVAPPVSTTPGVIGETRFEILNSSVQRDQDDELGVYLAGAGLNAAWRGYQLLISTDGGLSYTQIYTNEMPSTLGDTTTDLLAETSYERPGAQTVDVVTNFALESITYDQLLSGQNRCVIGDEEMQFQNAVLIAPKTYRLSNLVRGRHHSPIEHWPAGTRFVLFDESVIFVQAQKYMLGTEVYFKPVSLGTSEDETIPTSYDYDVGVSQLEWPVSTVEATRDVSDNVTVTWIPNARLGVDTSPYHSKYYLGSRVKFSDGHTIDTPKGTETATYNAAPVGATVQVCSLNEITGEGPYSTALAT